MNATVLPGNLDDWLERDQLGHWRRQLQRRTDLLNQARQNLSSSRIAGRGPSSDAQREVQKATALIEEARAKLKLVRGWAARYDSTVLPAVGRLDRFANTLAHDVPQAVAELDSVRLLLQAYAEAPGPEQTT